MPSGGSRTIHLNRKVIGPAPTRPTTIKQRKISDFPGVPRQILDVARLLSSPALIGPPLCDELVAFIRHIFTDEEASVVRHLTLRGRTAAEVAKAEHRPQEEIEPILKRLAFEKFAIYAVSEGTKRRYMVVPILPGLYELVMSGKDIETMSGWHRRFLELFDDLWETGYLALYSGADSPFIRYLPSHQAVGGHPLALPSDQLEVVFDRYTTFGLTDCECRTAATIKGRGCNAPKGNCMAMGEWAELGIDAGQMKRISKEEALERKREAEAHGLVTFILNMESSKGQASCSCCGCCCYAMRSITEFNAPALSAPPHFLPEIDRSKCTYCGKCAQRCPMGALAVEPKRKRAWQMLERCIGCGQCVVACDTQKAITMEPVPDYKLPPQSWFAFISRAAPGAARRAAGAYMNRIPAAITPNLANLPKNAVRGFLKHLFE